MLCFLPFTDAEPPRPSSPTRVRAGSRAERGESNDARPALAFFTSPISAVNSTEIRAGGKATAASSRPQQHPQGKSKNATSSLRTPTSSIRLDRPHLDRVLAFLMRMERFAAMVIGHRAASVPAPAPAAKGKNGKGKVVEDAAYLSIQLEEIVVVKNDDVASLGAARGRSTLTSGASTSMRQRVAAAAAAAPPSGMSAAAAARGALTTTDDSGLDRWLG